MARIINTVYCLRVTLGFCAVVHLLIALIQAPEYNIILEDYVRDLYDPACTFYFSLDRFSCS